MARVPDSRDRDTGKRPSVWRARDFAECFSVSLRLTLPTKSAQILYQLALPMGPPYFSSSSRIDRMGRPSRVPGLLSE